MKLSELYKEALTEESRQFEVIRSDGTLSGNKITLIDPASEKAARSVFMISVAEGERLNKYREENKELEKDCKDSGNFTSYNLGFAAYCQDLHDAFAVEVVEGWDFEDEFTEEALKLAIESYRAPLVLGLQRQIIAAFNKLNEQHAKK